VVSPRLADNKTCLDSATLFGGRGEPFSVTRSPFQHEKKSPKTSNSKPTTLQTSPWRCKYITVILEWGTRQCRRWWQAWTDRVMERIYHPSRKLAPCWSHLQKWEMMGDDGKAFSNPSATAWRVVFEGIPCMRAQLPLPQCSWCAPHGLYLHLIAVPVSKMVSLVYKVYKVYKDKALQG